MQILIMRHGNAAIYATSDPVRELTQNGIDETIRIGCWLQQQSYSVEKVLVSPYLRAEQTLLALGTCLTLPEAAEICRDLTPHGDVIQVTSYLHLLAQQKVKSVLLVSHLPLVGYLVNQLCPTMTPPMFVTSAIAHITLKQPDNQGHFEWLMTPEQLTHK